MKLIFFLFCASVIFNLSLSCGNAGQREHIPQVVKKVRTIDEGRYTEINHDNNSLCIDTRFKVDVTNSPRTRNFPQCNMQLPGLSNMENGAIKDFFYESSEEIINQSFGKVMYLTCESTYDKLVKKYPPYNVPHQIGLVDPIDFDKHYTRRIISVQTVREDLQTDTDFLKPENNYFLNLPILRFDGNFNTSAGYLGVTIYDHRVQMTNEIILNELLLQEYIKLPEHWRNNVKAYFKFIMQFGTHYRNSTSFGGKLFLLTTEPSLKQKLNLINFDDHDSVRGFISEVVHMNHSKDTRVSLYTFGGLSSLQSVDDWFNSIPQQPVPIESEFVPLNELLDSPLSEKYHSLSEFISFELNHQKYKKYLYAFKIYKNTSKLAQLVYQLIEKQVKYICPSNYLNSVLTDGITKEKNFKLNKFFLKCTYHDLPSNKNGNVRTIYENTVHLIPHVCFTFEKFLTACYDPQFAFPSGVQCIKLFQLENCRGTPIKVFEETKLNNIFYKRIIASASLCEAGLHN